jgi:hypothetical protein
MAYQKEIKLPDELTEAQESEFPKFREKWIEIGESTEPMDKEETYQAVMDCYDMAREELNRPEFVVFVKSPFQLFYTKPLWNRMVEYFSGIKDEKWLYSDDYDGPKQPEGALWFTTTFQTGDEDEDWLWGMRVKAVAECFDAIIDATKDKVPDIDFRGDERAYYRAFALFQKEYVENFRNILPRLKEEADKELGNEIYGQNETWLAFYEFMEWCGGEGLEGTHGLQRLAKVCGWWIPYDHMAVCADRPCELHVDDEGRLHSHDSASIRFRDGWRYYASHGTQLPAWIIEHPERITAKVIREERNVEIRRVMIEIFGMENFLSEANAKLIDRHENPEMGTLWCISMEDDEDIFLLEMQNSTQEPDGHYKTYVIRVPPNVRTAEEAMAWSYGFENPEEYKPVLAS